MNICLCIDGLRYGGKERQLSQIVKGLYQSKIKVYIITFNLANGCNFIFDKYCEKIFEIKRKFSKDLSPIWQINRLIKMHNFDCIYTFDSLSSFFSILGCKLNRIPLIDGSIRDTGVNHGSQYLFKRVLLKLSNFVVANSRAGLDYYKIKKGEVVYNAIDRKRFLRNKCNKKIIVMNANFSDYKDHKTFFYAVRPFVESRKIDEVFLIGDGKYKMFWKKKVTRWKNSKQYKFYGYVDNIEEILCLCSIGVLCSTKRFSEGISNSILEYMAAGLIAIGPNIGAIPEIIKHGINGFLYEPENVDSLIKVIENIIEKNHFFPKIINNAHKTISTKFSFDKNINNLLLLCQDIIKKNIRSKK